MSGIWTRALKRLNGALISGIGTTCQMAAVRKVTFLQLFVFLKAPPWFSEFVRSVDWCPTPSVSAASPTSSMNPIPKRVSNYSMARGMDKTPAFLEQTNHRQRDCASCSQRQAIGTGFNCDESRGATSASCPWTPREEDEEEMEEVNTSRASCSRSITAAWWFHLKWKTTESLRGLSVVEMIFPLGYQRVEFSNEKQCGLAGPETRP